MVVIARSVSACCNGVDSTAGAGGAGGGPRLINLKGIKGTPRGTSLTIVLI